MIFTIRLVITSIIFLILLFSFIATPAPINIEIYDIFLITLPCLLGLVTFPLIKNYYFDSMECNLLLAVLLYFSCLLISALIGLAHGIPPENVARNIGPHINFFPLLFLGFIPAKIFRPWLLFLPFICVGLLQSSYHFYLYYISSINSGSTLDVLIKRITLMDPRTSIPIYLSVAILPLCWFFNNESTNRKKFLSLLSILLMLIGLIAGVATLTRAIFLSILFGWLTFIFLYLSLQFRLHPNLIKPTIKKLVIYAIVSGLIIFLLLQLPAAHMLVDSAIARFYNYSPLTVTHDYSNGRLYDEWLPAFHTWQNADVVSLFFGIGAANPFILMTGEEHTYAHNISLYSLLYGGIYGLMTYLWLYYSIFKTLVLRAYHTNLTIYLAYAALLASLFFYVQLFAVYKLLSFNAMLFLIMALALNRPTKKGVN